MLHRNLTERVLLALSDSPSVFVQGARQCGKSTLVTNLAQSKHEARYITFDDAGTLSAANADAQGFLSGLDGNVIIDEVQLCPSIFPAIKAAIDKNRRAGRFLLTGSANALVIPELSQALVGRVELISLRTLSQGELAGYREGFVDWLFTNDPIPKLTSGVKPIEEPLTTGGYPESVARKTTDRRAQWFDSYISTILQRDIRDLASIDGLHSLPNLLRLCAARTAGLLNFTELARSLAVPQTTLKRYFALLEAVFLVQRVPAWSSNLGKRIVRSPKIFFFDSGLAAHLQGINIKAWNEPATRRGQLLENFVFGELEKQLGWSETRANLYHYRSHAGDEVDFILEDRKGRIVGIEVKASATPGAADAPLKKLATEIGKRFVRGIILYTGREMIPFDRNIHALPVEALWAKNF
ncbi:MAG: ATP-binding protein [Planctomycetota bacterium]